MRYNRALLPADPDPVLDAVKAELLRRQHGPVCWRCQFCPLDELDLPPILTSDSPGHGKVVNGERVFRTFFCEAKGRTFQADGGRGCSKFVAQ